MYLSFKTLQMFLHCLLLFFGRTQFPPLPLKGSLQKFLLSESRLLCDEGALPELIMFTFELLSEDRQILFILKRYIKKKHLSQFIYLFFQI